MSDPPSELHDLLEAYELAWNTHDADSVAAFFSREADMVVGNRPRVTGRDAISSSWATYFANIDKARMGEFEVDSVRMITPDVALININSTTRGTLPEGEELPTRLARGTWVLVNEAGQWRITALRALPAVGDVRESPGTDR